MNPSALLRGLPFVDSFFPSGGYACSYGLEAACQDGTLRNGTDLRDYITRLIKQGSGPSDAIAVALTHRFTAAGKIERVLEVDRQLEAMKSSRELREGSRQMGRQVIRIAARQFPKGVIPQIYERMESDEIPCHYAVALGSVLSICGWSEREAVLGYLYQTVVGWVSASLKLLPIGQQEGQELIHILQPCLIDVAEDIEDKGLKDMGSWTPLHDIRAMRHEEMEVRLFRS